MTLVVGVSTEGTPMPVPRAVVERVARATLRAEGVAAALLSITFVSSAVMRRLNRKHLRRTGDTDVISFGFRAAHRRAPLIGDVYIAPDVARRSARANAVTVREELTRLIVHGVLHVVGHDHPDGRDRTLSPMWRRQERLVRRFARSA